MREHKASLMGAAAVLTAMATGAAQAGPGDGRYYGHYGMMDWGGWFYGPIMMLVFFGLLVGAVVLIARLLGAGEQGAGTRRHDRALEILRERFARGELSSDEFEAARKTLG